MNINNIKLLNSIISLVLIIATTTTSSVYANNNNEVICYERGIFNGVEHPVSQQTYVKCGDVYYQGFIEGCMSVDGNERDICENVTDA